ncbi:MAG: hypothetical protein H7235_06645 [Bdellovibrionaceae bacterium]|nr:hypothetical protein [Pseudobdellovibrionaceae bacterium]
MFSGSRFAFLIHLNPFHYIVQGYRDSVLGGDFFFSHPARAGVFWIEVAALFLVASWIFNKLRSSFSDVI